MERRKFLATAAQGIIAVALVGCDSAETLSGPNGSAPLGAAPEPSIVSALRREAGRGGEEVILSSSPGRVALQRSGSEVWADESFNFPVAAVEDGAKLFVLDKGNSDISILDKESGELEAVMGSEHLNSPSDLALGSEALYVADTLSHSIQILDKRGRILGSFGELGESATQLNGPRGIVFDSRGLLHVLDWGNRRVAIYSSDGVLQSFYGHNGLLKSPSSIAVSGDQVFVTDCEEGCVLTFGSDGTFREKLDFTLDGKPADPTFVRVANSGQLLVTAVPSFSPQS